MNTSTGLESTTAYAENRKGKSPDKNKPTIDTESKEIPRIKKRKDGSDK